MNGLKSFPWNPKGVAGDRDKVQCIAGDDAQEEAEVPDQDEFQEEVPQDDGSDLRLDGRPDVTTRKFRLRKEDFRAVAASHLDVEDAWLSRGIWRQYVITGAATTEWPTC